MNNLQSKQWQKGDTHLINKLKWDKLEVEKIISCLEDDWFAGTSKYNVEFETRFKEIVGVKHCQTVNSGSSGIRIGVQALIQTGRIRKGDKFIHCGLTFPTSASGAILSGLVPVYVDCGVGTYNANTESIKQALVDYDIKLILLPALLGNMFDLDVCLNSGLPILIDSCDTIGTKVNERDILSLGTLAVTSFYASHHISTFIGGAVCTNDDELYEVIKSMTFWGRDFKVDVADRLTSFTKRYSYNTIGEDAQLSSVQAAFGLGQIERLHGYIGQREYVFRQIYELFKTKLNYFILPERVADNISPSWFCFPVTVRETAPFSRNDLINDLLDNNIEIRPVMTNLLSNDVYRKSLHYVSGDLKNTLDVERNGFFLPSFAFEKEQFKNYLDKLENIINKY